MAIYELGISIDGVPGVYVKYYDFSQTYSDLTQYSKSIRQNIINAISLDFTTIKQQVHKLDLESDLYVYMYSNLYKSPNRKRNSYDSAYLISDELIDEKIVDNTLVEILKRFLEFRPVPDKNLPIICSNLTPFSKTLDKILKDSPLKPIDRLKKALFVFD